MLSLSLSLSCFVCLLLLCSGDHHIYEILTTTSLLTRPWQNIMRAHPLQLLITDLSGIQEIGSGPEGSGARKKTMPAPPPKVSGPFKDFPRTVYTMSTSRDKHASPRAALAVDLDKWGSLYAELVQRCSSELREEKEALAVERAALEALSDKLLLKNDPARFESRVTLNVGGKLFVTNLDTLRTREPKSTLAALVAGNWQAETDDQGALFIDRYR